MIGILFWCSVIAIIYIYAGYPLIVTLLARIFTRPIKRQSISPPLTLLIAAYNEEDVIAGKIKNALALDYPKDLLQILVAADGSNDRTAEIVQSFSLQGVELSFIPERLGKMAAITRAMQVVRGEIVIFSDANNYYKMDALKLLVAPFADPAVGAVSGAKHIIENKEVLDASEGLYWKYESYIKKHETHLGSCTGVAGEILAVRRNLFVEPPPKLINDDFYILMQVVRQGFRVIYEPHAISYESISASAKDEIARRTRIIAGRYQAIGMAVKLLHWDNLLVVWQIVSHKFLRPFVPMLMISALAFNLIAVVCPPQAENIRWLWLASPFNVYLLGLQGLFYLAALLGNLIHGKGWIGKLLYLPSFLVNSNYAALNGFFRYLFGKQQAAWKKVNRQEEKSQNVNLDYKFLNKEER
ncbi:MAG: glycosyltransferase family 2 protein [Anaerolineaceae bacterium]|nr:glycosyltransferase family 2 protein [Anaerolineaceae bacterium]